MKQALTLFDRARNRRGFLLLVVIGLLAVLLVLVVGFVAYTRGETSAVATIRDKTDGVNLYYSTLDWTLAVIGNDLFDPSTNTPRAGLATGSDNDPKGIVSAVRNTGDAQFKWWYKPHTWDQHTWGANGGWAGGFNSYPIQSAQWIDLPASFFPQGTLKGRFCVQVLDASSQINANDWLDDCNPTQCQVAHMLTESVGDSWMEGYRHWRDTNGTLPSGAASVKYRCYPATGDGQNTRCIMRYEDAWRLATHSYRGFMAPYNTSIFGDDQVTPTWKTTNETYLGLYAMDHHCLRSGVVAHGFGMWKVAPRPTYGPMNYAPATTRDGPITAQYFDWWGMTWGATAGLNAEYTDSWNEPINARIGRYPPRLCFALWSQTDPDTGRSPVNVNTCYNSAESVPTNTQNGPTPVYTMESVFNAESLRRIVKVGKFFVYDVVDSTKKIEVSADEIYSKTAKDSTGNVIAVAAFYDAARLKIEFLRMKMACQYQETLCRYFTASYNHSNRYVDNTAGSATAFMHGTVNYNPISSGSGTYWTVYGAAGLGRTGATEANKVQNHCPMADYSKTRFPFGVHTFRRKVFDDLRVMSSNTAVGCLYNDSLALTDPYAFGMGRSSLNSNEGKDGDLYVSFDCKDRSCVALGKMDKRTASAVFDNIVPGKAILWPDSPAAAAQSPATPAYYGPTSGSLVAPPKPASVPAAYTVPAPPAFVAWSPAEVRSVVDPLTELYQLCLGRDETLEDWYNTQPNNPTPVTAAKPVVSNNVCGFFTDNFDVASGRPSDSGVSAVTGVPVPGAPPAMYIPASCRTLRAKGRDIAPLKVKDSSGAITNIPPGFYAQTYTSNVGGSASAKDVTVVPWRQRVFGPDWFSTELTTTSNCFYLIITVQITEVATGNQVFMNQWGAVAEVGADIACETDENDPNNDGKRWPLGGNSPHGSGPEGAVDWKKCGLGYYRGGWPSILKTVKSGDSGPYSNAPWDTLYSMDAYPDATIKPVRSESASQGLQYKTTAARQWADWRGVTTDPAMTGDPMHASNFYKGTNQIRKNLRIRAVWSLNSGVY